MTDPPPPAVDENYSGMFDSTKTKEVMVRFFIQSRPGVSGGEVTWEQMARHLDIRTLRFYSSTRAYVLWGRLRLEECVEIARFLA